MMLRSRSRKFWKGQIRILYLQLRNPGGSYLVVLAHFAVDHMTFA